MVNVTKLANIQAYDFNETLLNSTDMIGTAVSTTDTLSGGLYGIIVTAIVYFFVFITLIWEGGRFRYDLLSSHTYASGVCIILSTLLLLAGWISSFFTLSMYVVLFFIGMVGLYLSRSK